MLLYAVGKDPEWFLEIDAGDIDQRADSALNYVADPNQRRVTFAASGGLWSLRFPTPETYRAFMTELEVSRAVCFPWAGLGTQCIQSCLSAVQCRPVQNVSNDVTVCWQHVRNCSRCACPHPSP